MAAIKFRYEFCDLLTDSRITELEVSNPQFDGRIIQPGAFSGQISITNRKIAEEVSKITGGRSLVHIYLGDDLWGSYILWINKKATDTKGNLTANLTGAGIESAFHHRQIQQNLTFSQVDQLDIVRSLVAQCQDPVLNDNLSIVVDDTTSGVLRDRTYLESEAAEYGKRMSELANVENGFEYRIRTFQEGGIRVRRLMLGYPKIITSAKPHVFDLPGKVVTYKDDEDATRGGTRFRVRGDSVSDPDTGVSEPLMSDRYIAQQLIDDGWPLWDVSEDRSGVVEKNTLNEYAAELRAKLAGAVRIFQCTVVLDDKSKLTPNTVGDWAQITIKNIDHPLSDGTPNFRQTWRVVGMGVNPRKRGSGVTTADLIFQESDE